MDSENGEVETKRITKMIDKLSEYAELCSRAEHDIIYNRGENPNFVGILITHRTEMISHYDKLYSLIINIIGGIKDPEIKKVLLKYVIKKNNLNSLAFDIRALL